MTTTDEDVVPVPMIATCHTPGCPVDGIAFEATLFPCAAPPTYRAQCGQCGQAVTDLVPIAG